MKVDNLLKLLFLYLVLHALSAGADHVYVPEDNVEGDYSKGVAPSEFEYDPSEPDI